MAGAFISDFSISLSLSISLVDLSAIRPMFSKSIVSERLLYLKIKLLYTIL